MANTLIISSQQISITDHCSAKRRGFPVGSDCKEPACQCRRHRRLRFDPWLGKIPWRRERQPTPVSLPGESQGQRSLVGYSPWGHRESDMTERLTLSFSLSAKMKPWNPLQHSQFIAICQNSTSHSYIQQIFVKYLLGARHCNGCWAVTENNTGYGPCRPARLVWWGWHLIQKIVPFLT